MSPAGSVPGPLVLGIDPGSIRCGWALVQPGEGNTPRLVGAGVWHLGEREAVPTRLARLRERLDALLAEFRPEALCLEQAFVERNVRSALVLGQARGVVLAGCALAGLSVDEIPPSTAKQLVAGSGRASKEAVAEMCRRLLRLESLPVGPDGSDAVCLALAHLARRTSPATAALEAPKPRRGAARGFDLEAYLERIGRKS